MDWNDIAALILTTSVDMEQEYPHRVIIMRIKQWLAMLRNDHPEGQQVFQTICRMKELADIKAVLKPGA
jgi:hypothetical protein